MKENVRWLIFFAIFLAPFVFAILAILFDNPKIYYFIFLLYLVIPIILGLTTIVFVVTEEIVGVTFFTKWWFNIGT